MGLGWMLKYCYLPGQGIFEYVKYLLHEFIRLTYTIPQKYPPRTIIKLRKIIILNDDHKTRHRHNQTIKIHKDYKEKYEMKY